jgi:Rrf2 family protein
VFQKETEYALCGLVYVQYQNLKGRRPGIIEIATEIETPPSFTAKILQRLVRFGFLESQKGKNGGFYFDKTKPDLSLKEIIVAIEGDKIFSGCVFGLKYCDENSSCPLHGSYAPIRDAMKRLVPDETIQSLGGKNYGELEIVLNCM